MGSEIDASRGFSPAKRGVGWCTSIRGRHLLQYGFGPMDSQRGEMFIAKSYPGGIDPDQVRA